MKFYLALAAFVTAVSLSCTAYNSAGSQTPANSSVNLATTTPTPVSTNEEQEPCKLALADAPVIDGLGLGMTREEVLALFPGSQDDADLKAMLTRPASPLGVSELGIKPSKYGLKNNFADVNQVTFTFLDGRASGVSVTYNGPEYPNVDQFVTRFVEGRNLPPADRWQAHEGLDTQLKILACKEFEVRVFAGGKGGNLNYVQLSDLVASVTLKDRRKKARAKAAASPSPQ